MDATEQEFTTADVRAWRRSGWIFVSLNNEIVLRRFTRDKAFTQAVVIFRENRSPLYPKTRENFVRADVATSQISTAYRGPGSANRLTVPIEKEATHHAGDDDE